VLISCPCALLSLRFSLWRHQWLPPCIPAPGLWDSHSLWGAAMCPSIFDLCGRVSDSWMGALEYEPSTSTSSCHSLRCPHLPAAVSTSYDWPKCSIKTSGKGPNSVWKTNLFILLLCSCDLKQPKAGRIYFCSQRCHPSWQGGHGGSEQFISWWPGSKERKYSKGPGQDTPPPRTCL
jgi:hypothetical protein